MRKPIAAEERVVPAGKRQAESLCEKEFLQDLYAGENSKIPRRAEKRERKRRQWLRRREERVKREREKKENL